MLPKVNTLLPVHCLVFFQAGSGAVNGAACVQMAPSKTITFIFSVELGQFPMPNLVLKTIITIKKPYGVKICVFMALLCGAQLPVLATIDFGHQNWWNVVNFLFKKLS